MKTTTPPSKYLTRDHSDYTNMQNSTNHPIEDLIHRFAYLGPHTDIETIASLITRKDEALPYLIKIAKDEEYWDVDNNSYSVWATICSIHLLSVIGGMDALNAVCSAIVLHPGDTGDWITEDMSSVLAWFGPSSFDILANVINDHNVDAFVRSGAARALLMISCTDKEIKSRSVELLRQTISSEKDKLVRTLLVNELVEFKDPTILDFVKPLFEKKLIDKSFTSFEEILDVYAGKYDYTDHAKVKDPMKIFEPSPDNFYRKSNNTSKKDDSRDASDDDEIGLQKKVGRNDS
ncbi:MAG: DUF1186 domain-containing protein [Nitrosotalea sp.]